MNHHDSHAQNEHDPDAQDDEFDTVAGWTADAAVELGPNYAIPAGCRGSGGPNALDWLLDRLRVTTDDHMLDCGAGVGGPAAFAADRTGVTPVLTEPMPGACRAAQRLFGVTAIIASGQDLPFVDATFDVAWSLAVLCTTSDKSGALRELRRVLSPRGRLGLLVYVRTADDLSDGPEGNAFPTRAELDDLLCEAGFTVDTEVSLDDLPADSKDWTDRQDAVTTVLHRRHGDDEAWQTSQQQSEAFGELLSDGRVQGHLCVAHCG